MIARKTTFHRIERERPAPFRMVLRWPRVTRIGSPPHPRPADRGGTPGPRGPTDARPPPQPRRGASRSPLRAPARSRPGVWRLGARLPPGPRRPPHAQGALGGGRGPDASGACAAGPPPAPPPGSRPPRDGPALGRDARVAPSRRQATGVAPRAGPPRPPGPLSPSGHARRALGDGSGRRKHPDPRRVAPSPHPHGWRRSLCRATLHHVIRWNVEKLPLYLGFFAFVHNARKRGKALLHALIALLVK
jgi:hypothetical protein